MKNFKRILWALPIAMSLSCSETDNTEKVNSSSKMLNKSYSTAIDGEIQGYKNAAVIISDQYLKLAIQDALANLDKVKKINITPAVNGSNSTGGGNTKCYYDKITGVSTGYEITYGTNDLGTLLHELVHVSVNEKLKFDFLNYTNPIAGIVPPPVYGTFDQTGGGSPRLNEFDRQTKRLSHSLNQDRLDNMSDLNAILSTCKRLSSSEKKFLQDKFAYSNSKPHLEYSTILLQTSYFLYKKGFPVQGAPVSVGENSLYTKLMGLLRRDLITRKVL